METEHEETVNILHPLSKLNFGHCYTWTRDVRPINCAALNNVVIILEHHEEGDILNITSQNLSSWTIFKLPYYRTSLTKFQSYFTIIGGRHPVNRITTDQLMSSENGLKWTSSLPSMPTKRYFVASTSCHESKILVVAGGLSQDDRVLDSVEVLVNEQWNVVDPLPIPSYRIWSEFHDGNIYITQGVGWDVLVFHCNCSSLVSSGCVTSLTTRSSKTVWKTIPGTADCGTLVSFGQHLVSIDEDGTTFGLCRNSNSWVRVCIGGDNIKNYTRVVCFMHVAAAVLPSGNLLFCTNYGVYLGKLSLSTFDLEKKFVPNVIMKLEAMMGIGIPSTLSDVHSKLKAVSGVQPRTRDKYGNHLLLPNPNESPKLYVCALFSYWSEGCSWRPPKWKEFFEVLRKIEKLESICLQIEHFMTGEAKYWTEYHHYVTGQTSLDLLFLKSLIFSSPQLGEHPTLRHRLIDVVDLNSAGIVEKDSSILDTQIEYEDTSQEQPSACQFDETTLLEHSPRRATEIGQCLMPPAKRTIIPLLTSIPTFQAESLKFLYSGDLKQICLRVQDVGGQPELIDMLPAFTIGPGVYLLFVDLQNDLDRSNLGGDSQSVGSLYNTKEVLLSSLCKISCYSISSEMCKFTQTPKSAIYVVNTHKNKENTECVYKGLQTVVKSTGIYDSMRNNLDVTVCNIHCKTKSFKKIQTLLEKNKRKHLKKIRIPAKWLVFLKGLQFLNKSTASLEECLQWSNLLHMTPSETNVALWFLHHHAGVIMYFPNLPELKDFVLLDYQVVYDTTAFLIARLVSLRGEAFKKTGMFSLSQIPDNSNETADGSIPIHKLVSLLEYLFIAAKVSALQQKSLKSLSDSEVIYFMPCVVNSATEEELEYASIKQNERSPVCPIMISFKCGFVPVGTFTSIVACLSGKDSFALVKEGIRKNLVKFCYGPNSTLLTLIRHSMYYEIIIAEFTSSLVEPHAECFRIKKEIESAFSMVGRHLNYGYFTKYQFAFECPWHEGRNRDHLCLVDDTCDLPLMQCPNRNTSTSKIELSIKHMIWFNKTHLNSQVSSEQAVTKKLSDPSVQKISTNVKMQSAKRTSNRSWNISWKSLVCPWWIILPSLAILILSLFFRYLIVTLYLRKSFYL